MRIIKTTFFLTVMFCYYNSNAQTDKKAVDDVYETKSKNTEQKITLPKFQGDILVLRTIDVVGTWFNPQLTISDGNGAEYVLELLSMRPKNEAVNAKTLATVLNQLKQQGYKLISSTGGGGGGGGIMVLNVYIFQKE